MKWMAMVVGVLGVQVALAGPVLVDFELGMIFPQQLGGMEFELAEKYENDELGYSLFYEKDGGFSAEVSVFNLGRESIESGNKQVGVIFQQVEAVQQRKQKGELISNFRKRGTTEVPKKSAIRFANRIYQYNEFEETDESTNTVARIQSVYVTVAHHQFIRVQFYFDFTESKAAGGMSEQLIAQLIGILKGGKTADELVLAGCDVLINDPSSYAGRVAAQQVLKKVETMGELNVYTHLFAWPTAYWRRPKNVDLLIAAYFAGMLQVVIPQQLESGGEAEGFATMLRGYEAMRAHEEIEAIPKLDEWVVIDDKKTLFEELLYEPVEE